MASPALSHPSFCHSDGPSKKRIATRKSRPPRELMAEPTRLELATSGVTVRCANQLHHGSAPIPIWWAVPDSNQ